MSKYIYIAIFVDAEEVYNKAEGSRLEKLIRFPHVTLKFKPESVNESLFGEKVTVKIIGYGNNGDNEGWKVDLYTENLELRKMIDNVEVPHITLSTSLQGKPVDTKNLQFEECNGIILHGIFGGYTYDNTVVMD